MSDLILKEIKETKTFSSRFSTYHNDVITVNDFLDGEIWLSDISPSNINKINAWVNAHLWRWFVSPIILFCSLALFVMAPRRIFEVTLHGSFFQNMNAYLKRRWSLDCISVKKLFSPMTGPSMPKVTRKKERVLKSCFPLQMILKQFPENRNSYLKVKSYLTEYMAG